MSRQHLVLKQGISWNKMILPSAPMMTRRPPGARMLESLARVGASWEVEVRENSRHSLMVTRAGRRPPSRRRGCSTPSLEVTLSALTPPHTLLT